MKSFYITTPIYYINFSQNHFDLAYSVQKKYEEILLFVVNKFKGNHTKLCLSGGCALNCLANSKLLNLFEDNLMVVIYHVLKI